MSEPTAQETRPVVAKRIGWLDVARGIALLAMASYHLIWDFEYFHYLEPGTASHGWPKLYARAIATTFLFLAGFGLALAHRRGIQWTSYWKRFAKVAGAAALVTVATWFAMPQGFVYFGILHEIALASLIGLLFLRVPSLLTLVIAVAVIVIPNVYRSDLFSAPYLVWIGLAPKPPASFDFVPVLPWLGPVLIGIAIGRIEKVQGWLKSLAAPRPMLKPFAFAGRHSLIVYLLHQIPLFGLVYLLSVLAPPDQGAAYMRECVPSCQATGSGSICQRFCACTLDKLNAQNLLSPLQNGEIKAADERLQSIAGGCSVEAEQ